jgi:hypothetical protein
MSGPFVAILMRSESVLTIMQSAAGRAKAERAASREKVQAEDKVLQESLS